MKMYALKEPGEVMNLIDYDDDKQGNNLFFLQMPTGSHSFELGNGIMMAFTSEAEESIENVYIKRKDGIQNIPSRCVFFRPKPDTEIENGFERIVPLENDDLLFLAMLLNPLYQMQLKQEYMTQSKGYESSCQFAVKGVQNE